LIAGGLPGVPSSGVPAASLTQDINRASNLGWENPPPVTQGTQHSGISLLKHFLPQEIGHDNAANTFTIYHQQGQALRLNEYIG
jgi:hypothetical protein